MRLDQSTKRGPWNDSVHLTQNPLSPRRLVVNFEAYAGKCLLPHGVPLIAQSDQCANRIKITAICQARRLNQRLPSFGNLASDERDESSRYQYSDGVMR